MKTINSQSIKDMILEEKRCIARNLLNEAWEFGLQAGVEPEILADEMMHALICEMAKNSGPGGAAALTERISQMAQEGHVLAGGRL